MNDFIINVLQLPRGDSILFGQPWDSFLPPLFGSLIGVFLAYLLAKGTERYLNVQKRAKWLELIRTELKQVHSDLIEHQKFADIFFATHNELLKSLVSSADLNLFQANEAIALSLLYTRCDNYNKNIARINGKIEQFKNMVKSENPVYGSLLEQFDELDELQPKTPEIQGRINKLNDNIRGLETYSKVLIEIESASGIDYGKRMRSIIETYRMQEWLNDEKKHLFFPKHMSKSDEAILENLTKLRLVPESR